jgi:hypothetical protein
MILTHFSREPLDFIYDKKQDNEWFKPNGLWLSDENDDWGWSAWCKNNDFLAGKHKTEFEVDLNNVLHLKNNKEVNIFEKAYPLKGGLHKILSSFTIDWVAVAKDYKGILITPYNKNFNLGIWHSSWDVSSGCFWDVSCLKVKEKSNA